MTLDEIRQSREAGSLSTPEAIEQLTSLISTLTDSMEKEQALTLRGELYWKYERRAEAINDYNAAIAINPDSAAVKLKEAAYAILDFYNKDLYNP